VVARLGGGTPDGHSGYVGIVDRAASRAPPVGGCQAARVVYAGIDRTDPRGCKTSTLDG